jgi:hypothetical protein
VLVAYNKRYVGSHVALDCQFGLTPMPGAQLFACDLVWDLDSPVSRLPGIWALKDDSKTPLFPKG